VGVLVVDDVDHRRSDASDHRPADLAGRNRLPGDDESTDVLVGRGDGSADECRASLELVGVTLGTRLNDGAVDAEDAEARQVRSRFIAHENDMLLRSGEPWAGASVGVDASREMRRVHERVVRPRRDAERIAGSDLAQIASHVPIPRAAKLPVS